VENQDGAPLAVASRTNDRKLLFKDFMGLNGHFGFKPEVYRQVGHLVRNYHNLQLGCESTG